MLKSVSIDSQSSSPLSNDVAKLLQDSQFDKLKALFIDKGNYAKLCENGWDLLVQLMKFLKNEKVEKENLKCFEDIFLFISTVASYKEIFLGILEQIDPMVDLVIVELLFPALKACSLQLLEKDKRNQIQNLSMMFSSLMYYMESLNLPKYKGYQPLKNPECKEELHIASYILQCVDLANAIVSAILNPIEIGETDNALDNVKCEIICFCFGLLERLSHLDLDEKQETSTADKSVCHPCQEEIKNNMESKVSENDRKSFVAACKLCILLKRLVNSFELYRAMQWSKFYAGTAQLSEEDLNGFEISRAVYIYLNLVKANEALGFPQILHPEYVLVCSIPSILVLWKSANPVQVHKGMELARVVTNCVEQRTLRCRVLTQCRQLSSVSDPVNMMLDSAIQVALQCPTLVLRQRAVQFIKKFLDKLDWPDRYNLVFHLLTTLKHPGVIGYLMGYFKDKIAELLQISELQPRHKYFIDKKRLKKVFDICFDLPYGSDTDLLAEYDKIMASLNLLRFLFIRDASNITGIRDELESLQRSYLNPLRTAINLSRMHFRDELLNPRDPGKDRSQPSMMINGINLSALPLRDRKQALHSAVNSFDVLQSICIRVQELAEKKPASS